MNEPKEHAQSRARRPGERGDVRVNDYLAEIVRMLAEMEQGMRPVGALDDISSPLAARRIRKLLQSSRSEGSGGRRRPVARPEILCASSTAPSAGVTEGLVVVRCAGRVRPYCVRLEQEGAGWRLVELAPPDIGLRAAITAASRDGGLYVGEDGLRRSSGRDGVPYSAPPMLGHAGRRIPPFLLAWARGPEAEALLDLLDDKPDEERGTSLSA